MEFNYTETDNNPASFFLDSSREPISREPILQGIAEDGSH